MAALLEGLRAVGSARVLDDVLGLVMDSSIAVSGAERGFIMLANSEGELEFKMGRSRDNVALQISEKIKRPDSVKSELHVFTKGGKKIDSDAELAELEDDLHLSDGVDLDW